MKTQKIIMFSIAILLASTFQVIAQENKDTKITTKHQVSIHVDSMNNVAFYANNLTKERSNYILKVYSENGKMLYATTFINKGGIEKAFNLSEFPEGTYNFKVYAGLKQVYNREIEKTSAMASNKQQDNMVVELVRK